MAEMPDKKINTELDDKKMVQEEVKKISKSLKSEEEVDFYCDEIYKTIYPKGYQTIYQGIIISLDFNGTTIKMKKPVAEFVKAQLRSAAKLENDKANSTVKSAGSTMITEIDLD